MKLEKKYVIISVITLSILLFGVSYAYYKAKIVGDPTDIGLTAKEVYLKYNGSNTLVSTTIIPGWSETKTFTIENESKREETYNIVIEDLVNTFVTTGYLQYKITSDTGYNMSDYEDIPKSSTSTDRVLAYNISIPASTIQNYTIELIYRDTTEDQSADMGKTLSGILVIDAGTLQPTLVEAILRDNPTISERTDFSVTNDVNTTGTIYKTNKTEDGSEVYYYSGNTTNNWVKFGKYLTDSVVIGRSRKYDYGHSFKNFDTLDQCNSDSSYNYNCHYVYRVGDEMYWRIIRTNEDGSVRLLYAGTSHNTTEGNIGISAFNSSKDSSRYVGYMYGGNTSLADNRTNTTSSTAKVFIDNWYQNNLLVSYDKYISKSAIYCNDRSIGKGTWVDYWCDGFDYGSTTRLWSNKAPNYKCGANATGGLFESTQAVADKFSASTTGGGNGQLSYNVALMTADEVAFAGAVYDEYAGNLYLFINSEEDEISDNWTTLSPGTYVGTTPFVYFVTWGGFTLETSGNIDGVSDTRAIRPVLSIDSCAKVKGSGTATDPYVIDESASTC